MTQPIAIVSIGAMFPGAPTTAAFWRDLMEGRDRLTEVPKTHWLREDYFAPKPGTPDKVYATKGGFLSEIDFSPIEFGLPPNTLPAIDTAQLLSLLVAKRVLSEATRGRYESMDRSKISVILGVASATELVAHMSGRLQLPVVERAMRAGGLSEPDVARIMRALEGCYVPWQENTFPGMLGNVVAGRISNRLDLGGTNTVLDAACAGSLAAVAMAAGELSLGISDLVITGGVDTLNDILMFMCFAQTGALSLTGDCRPFSNEADGTMLGEGIGLFALRRLEDAERDKDPIYAVLRGVGSSSDGKAMSIYAPSAKGQAKALQRAYENAGVTPDTIGLIEAHGTGTKAGDATELEALLQVYQGVPAEQCAIGSVKGQIGHTKAAAGAAGLAKAALALHHKVLPPTIKVSAPSHLLAERKTPFYVNTAARPWIASKKQPRRAAVSALGFGGTNFHVIVEEYLGESRPMRIRAMPSELITLHAKDAKSLAVLCQKEADGCREPGSLVHLAKRAQLSFDASAPLRLALVASDEEELSQLLQASVIYLAERKGNPPRGVYLGEGEAAGPVAFLFPGQGSQYLNMGAELALHFDAARALWDQATTLPEFEREPLQSRVFPVPVFSEEDRAKQEAQLTQTDWAQPALSCTSLSMLQLLHLLELKPVCVAGHSLGEVTALAASGALSALDAIRVARLRGEQMAEASRTTEGAMLAVASDRSTVERLLDSWKLPLSLANHNSPQQVVLSGSKTAIKEAEGLLSKERIAARPLSVATAFHSPIVAGACAPFRDILEKVSFQPFTVPAYSNVTATPYPHDAGEIRAQLASAVAKPVRFVEMLDAMYEAGARTFIEVGAETVLTRLVGRCLQGKPHLAVSLDQPGKNGATSLHHALARLSAAGVAMRLEALWTNQSLPEDPSQKPPSKMNIRLSGANYGKPYPQKADELMSKAKPTDTTPQTTTQVMEPPSKAALAEPVSPAPMVLARPADSNWLLTLRELHAPLIAAQMEYERLMAESHATFLHTIEASYSILSGGARPSAPVTNGRAYQTPQPVVFAASQLAAPQLPAPRPLAPMPAPVHVPAPIAAPAPAPMPAPIVVAPAAPKVTAPASVDVKALMPKLLEIVAEKTGYPIEMIQPTMDMESELGIDSIKRVEILAAMKERVPGLPESDPSKMSKLRTLAEIARFFEPGATAPAEPAKKKL